MHDGKVSTQKVSIICIMQCIQTALGKLWV